MITEIPVHPMGAVLTITFLNKTHVQPTPTVWVCENRDAYESGMRELLANEHIHIVQSGPSHVRES